ncbi:MAG: hypothetical protein ACOCV2_00625 [Persicimonas sp.]
MGRRILDTTDLPDEAWESLRDYYEFLRERYVTDDSADKAFDPRRYRGAIDVDRSELEEQLASLRDEWDRHD